VQAEESTVKKDHKKKKKKRKQEDDKNKTKKKIKKSILPSAAGERYNTTLCLFLCAIFIYIHTHALSDLLYHHMDVIIMCIYRFVFSNGQCATKVT